MILVRRTRLIPIIPGVAAPALPQKRVHDPAAHIARVVPIVPPEEGVGNAGCPVHPQPRVRKWWLECTRVFTASSPETPGIPARNGLRLITRSPRRSGFVVSVAGETFADLTPTMRRQDHTPSPSAKHAVRQRRLRVHRSPLQRS